MLWCSVVLVAFSASSVVSNLFGPKYPPTSGEVWPKPRSQSSESIYYKYSPNHFNVSVTGQTCDILINAIERYTFFVRDIQRVAWRYAKRHRRRKSVQGHDENHKGFLQQLQVDLSAPCEKYPYFEMGESYNLTVAPIAQLKSSSIWGILRGLETWSQLFYFPIGEADIRINKTEIVDSPRYPHRGLLIDTSRHYVSLSNIIKTLDAMAMNKMNVLHWHIVDDQSFPYQSQRFPDLSRLGAYHSSMIYTKENIQKIIIHARDRGIRVLPEFDVPGHTRSWGQAYPNILTSCYRNGVVTDLGPMNPIKNVTYKLLQDLITEVQEWFPDKYFHIGGDEVDLACWESNPELREYMKAHNMTSADKLHALFMENVIPLLGQKSQPIVWQEVYDEGVPLSKDTLIHVWKGGDIFEMRNVLQAGYKVLYSSSWYLDQLKNGGDWEDFYKADPRHMVARFSEDLNLDNIVGGEACMWGEVVNDNNIISRVWPRASAVAEILWSPASANYYSISEEVYHRLEEHVCRMNRRGISAQPPSGPGFCLGMNSIERT